MAHLFISYPREDDAHVVWGMTPTLYEALRRYSRQRKISAAIR